MLPASALVVGAASKSRFEAAKKQQTHSKERQTTTQCLQYNPSTDQHDSRMSHTKILTWHFFFFCWSHHIFCQTLACLIYPGFLLFFHFSTFSVSSWWRYPRHTYKKKVTCLLNRSSCKTPSYFFYWNCRCILFVTIN